jgi:hypothetical protein
LRSVHALEAEIHASLKADRSRRGACAPRLVAAGGRPRRRRQPRIRCCGRCSRAALRRRGDARGLGAGRRIELAGRLGGRTPHGTPAAPPAQAALIAALLRPMQQRRASWADACWRAAPGAALAALGAIAPPEQRRCGRCWWAALALRRARRGEDRPLAAPDPAPLALLGDNFR